LSTRADRLNEEVAAGKRCLLTYLIDLGRRLGRDRQGVGAIEFAIIAPVLLLLYLGALEFTIGLSVAKRASRAAGTISDIITQEDSTLKSTLNTMPNVAASILAPYGVGGLTLKVSGIKIDASSNAKILWSWSKDGTTPYATGVAVTLPTDLNQANSFLVRTELSIPYQLFSFGPDFLPNADLSQITISRQSFYRQRKGDDVKCSDC
jgi:Flp pilus assembly protein TadG